MASDKKSKTGKFRTFPVFTLGGGVSPPNAGIKTERTNNSVPKLTVINSRGMPGDFKKFGKGQLETNAVMELTLFYIFRAISSIPKIGMRGMEHGHKLGYFKSAAGNKIKAKL